MLPRLRSQRVRLESSIELRDPLPPAALETVAETEEALSPEDERRRCAYAEWLESFHRVRAAV
jgi:hypothetical protein